MVTRGEREGRKEGRKERGKEGKRDKPGSGNLILPSCIASLSSFSYLLYNPNKILLFRAFLVYAFPFSLVLVSFLFVLTV